VDSSLTEHLTRFYREQKQRVERREKEIREYHERIEREIRSERKAEERQLRAELTNAGVDSSLVKRLARFYNKQRQEVKFLERQISEREEREAEGLRLRAEREVKIAAAAKERSKQEAEKQARVEKLEEILESKLLKEVETIREVEERVQKRKHMIQAYIQELPASKRDHFGDSFLK